jgi:hypothetical protein
LGEGTKSRDTQIEFLCCSDKCSLKVLAWASSQPLAAQFLSAITILGLELGVLQKGRGDAAQAAVLRAWLDGKVLRQFAGRILPLDQAFAVRCTRPHVPDRVQSVTRLSRPLLLFMG